MTEPVFIEEPGSGCLGCGFLIFMTIVSMMIFANSTFEKIAKIISDIADFIYILIVTIGWTVVIIGLPIVSILLLISLYKYYRKS